jgi:putative FmdB family regulatory protein
MSWQLSEAPVTARIANLMPTYSYKCTNCDHRFEARQRFSDDPLSECPVCASPVRKVITPVGIVFKGSGFYVTDNKNGKAVSTANGSGSSSKTDTSEKTEKSDKGEKADSSAATASTSSSKADTASASGAA